MVRGLGWRGRQEEEFGQQRKPLGVAMRSQGARGVRVSFQPGDPERELGQMLVGSGGLGRRGQGGRG